MTKRKRKPTGFYGDNYWQTADWNQRSFLAYRQWILSMAMNRCKWINLPESCDERYLEFILIREGVATIAHPKSMPEMWVSTKTNLSGRWNVYDTPIYWESIGNNGWRFKVNPSNGVLVFDNRQRQPYWSLIEYYARRLAAMDRVEDINLSHQKTPWLITAPREMVNDAKQVYKQIAGGEQAIIAKPTIQQMGIEAINTNVPYLGKELTEKKLALWDEIYSFLGIAHVGQKSERLTSEEVSASNEPSSLMALDVLNARRDAANVLNNRFGLNIQVVWRKDNESDMYNYMRNPVMNQNLLENSDRNSSNAGLETSHE